VSHNIHTDHRGCSPADIVTVDPKKIIRLTLAYPASTGRNFAEILRVIDSLQLGDKHKVVTPADWKRGDPVIIHNSVQGDQVKELFGDDVNAVYVSFTSWDVEDWY
jgi:alkyl hydroperoxide reductase subunit AhpC